MLKFCIFAQVYASMFDAKQVVFVLHLRQGNVLLVLSATSGELYAPSFDLCGQKYSLLYLLHENLYLLSILAYFMLAILCAAKRIVELSFVLGSLFCRIIWMVLFTFFCAHSCGVKIQILSWNFAYLANVSWVFVLKLILGPYVHYLCAEYLQWNAC